MWRSFKPLDYYGFKVLLSLDARLPVYLGMYTILNLWAIVKCRILLNLLLGICIYLLLYVLCRPAIYLVSLIVSFPFCFPLCFISVTGKIQLDAITDALWNWVVLHNRNLCLSQAKSNPRENVMLGPCSVQLFSGPGSWGPECCYV